MMVYYLYIIQGDNNIYVLHCTKQKNIIFLKTITEFFLNDDDAAVIIIKLKRDNYDCNISRGDEDLWERTKF